MDLEQFLQNDLPLAEASDYFLRIRGKYKAASAQQLDTAFAALPAQERAALLKRAGIGDLARSAVGFALEHPKAVGGALGAGAGALAGGPDHRLAGAAAGGGLGALLGGAALKGRGTLEARQAILQRRPPKFPAAGDYVAPGIPLLKRANMDAPLPAPLPAAARGQLMTPQPPASLPATALGQNPVPAAKMAEDKSPDAVGKERARAALSAEFEKEKHHRGESYGSLVGKLLGGAVGADAMHRYGKGQALATLGGAALGQHMGGQLGRALGASHDRRAYAKTAAFKRALQEMGVTPQLDPATAQLLAAQQQGDQLAAQDETAFLRQKLDELRQQSDAAAQQAQTLQQQQAMSDQQVAQYQGQIADATQKAMAAQDQVLQQQQAAAAMRMAFQQLRGTLLEAASQEPPSLTPTPATDAASQQASQAAGASSAPSPSSGPAGDAPNPGVPPAGMAPTGDDTVSTPAEKNEPLFEGATPALTVGQKEPTGDAKIPNKEVLAHALKRASARDTVARALRPTVISTLVGAGLGGLGGGLEAHQGVEPLRQSVKKLENKPHRSYGETVNLAQKRSRLTMREFFHEHPHTAVALGALGGAGTGFQIGPATVASLQRSKEHLKGIADEIKLRRARHAG